MLGDKVCKQCRTLFLPGRGNPGIFCSVLCKSEWQRTTKPVDYDWLYEKYIVEQRSAKAISRIVKRDPKRVWQWLRDYDIPTRSRGRDPASVGSRFRKGCPSAFLGRRHTEAARQLMRETAIADGRVPFDPKVGPFLKGKRGPEIPHWKGGVTPERQAFYSSAEWKAAVVAVWRRDNATCQRCGKRKRLNQDIHHIVSFAYKTLRAELSNLVLLCEECHYWVHSSENVDRLFIKEIPSVVA